MINIHPLYSSSSGNMFHIDNGRTNILIDAGVTYKAMTQGLTSIEKDINDISAVLITHEHIDHIKGIPLLCRKTNIPVYACGKTADYINGLLKEKNIPENVIKIEYNKPFKINGFEILPFETPHDAIMPCGYRIKSGDTTLSYATDLGHMSNEVFENLKSSNFVVLEANYDTAMLEFGKYPYTTKRRIKGPTGHLSNDSSAITISRLAKLGQANFVLAHLSENNNNEDIAFNTIVTTLNQEGIDASNLNINFASKTLSSEEYNIC